MRQAWSLPKKYFGVRVVVLLLVLVVLAPNAVEARERPALDVVDTFSIAFDPLGVAVNEVTDRVYLPGFKRANGERVLAVLDGKKGRDVSFVPLGMTPAMFFHTFGEGVPSPPLAVHPGRNRIYLPGSKDPTNERVLAVIDGATHQVLLVPTPGITPLGGVAVNPSLDRVYFPAITDLESRRVLAVANALTGVVTALVPLGELDPVSGIAVDPVANRVYLPSRGDPTGSGQLAVVESIGGAVDVLVSTVPIGTRDPGFIGVNPVTGNVYIVDDHGGELEVVDRDTLRAEFGGRIGMRVAGLAVDPVLDRVYVSGGTALGGEVVVFERNIESDRFESDPVPLDVRPWRGIAVNPVMGRVYQPSLTIPDNQRVMVVLRSRKK